MKLGNLTTEQYLTPPLQNNIYRKHEVFQQAKLK